MLCEIACRTCTTVWANEEVRKGRKEEFKKMLQRWDYIISVYALHIMLITSVKYDWNSVNVKCQCQNEFI